MLQSLAIIFLFGLSAGYAFHKLRLPALLGMLLTGVLIGPYVLNLIDKPILDISGDIRKIALVIILTRAGLAMNLSQLRTVGRPAVLMSFVPACFEIVGIAAFAPLLFGISITEAILLGTVVAAVSPAVVVPKMLNLIGRGLGVKKAIPQMIMAAGSIDDIFVIVLFSIFTSIVAGEEVSYDSILLLPVAIITGLLCGIALGCIVSAYFKRFHLRDSVKVIIVLCISFLLVSLETKLEGIFPFSGLLAVMSLSAAILYRYPELASRLSVKFSKLWIAAEILLFVLVGACVNIHFIMSAGFLTLLLLIISLLFRFGGVATSLLKTHLSLKERVFCMIAYSPKATVQAAIGSIPLAMGLPCGELILTVAVLSIIITAPLGAYGIERFQEKLLCD